jgi:hypothetical protein
MKPLNHHVLIQPLEQDAFIATQRTSYEEIGIVLDIAEGIGLPIGCKVYFDSWVAKKFPVKGEPGKYNWYVEYKDIVAYEPLPE